MSNSKSPDESKTNGSVLDRIVARTRETVAISASKVSLQEQQRRADQATPPRGFQQAIADQTGVSLIAEVKKASPSKGIIRDDFHPVEIAKLYEQAGATCISVLTDEPFFQGRLDYLVEIRAAVSLPLLRKDFILTPYQVYEARAVGADAVLLIAECLSDEELQSLRELIESLGMTALVEFYQPENASRVVAAGATLIGVNNRDLHTFETDLHHTFRMKDRLPQGTLVVGESGIRDHDDVKLLAENGIAAMLVGESLMRQPDVAAAVRNLLGAPASGS
jgi:indole-3-glycerol phosphate synthase